MNQEKGAKEAIWAEVQLLMDRQFSEGPLSEEEQRSLDRLTAALSILDAPERSSPRNVFQKLDALQEEQKTSQKELRRIAAALEESSRKRRFRNANMGFFLGLVGVWLGLSVLFLLIFQVLDAFTVRILCAVSLSGFAMAVFALEKQLEKNLANEFGKVKEYDEFDDEFED